MIICGLDPGKTGAMVTLFEDGSTIVDRVPLLKRPPLKGKKTRSSIPDYAAWKQAWALSLDFNCPDVIVREDVHGWKGQAAGASFAFGYVAGFAHSIILGVAPIHAAPPSVWKIKLGLLNLDKNASRARAAELIPSLAPHLKRAMDDGVAEAGLLAYYAKMTISG